jgi:hypothetical protein
MWQSSEASDTCRSHPVKHAREVMKSIFLLFIVTLPVIHTLFRIFGKKTSRKPLPQDLYEKHNLAG